MTDSKVFLLNLMQASDDAQYWERVSLIKANYIQNLETIKSTKAGKENPFYKAVYRDK